MVPPRVAATAQSELALAREATWQPEEHSLDCTRSFPQLGRQCNWTAHECGSVVAPTHCPLQCGNLVTRPYVAGVHVTVPTCRKCCHWALS
jgi:hypothetical protein